MTPHSGSTWGRGGIKGAISRMKAGSDKIKIMESPEAAKVSSLRVMMHHLDPSQNQQLGLAAASMKPTALITHYHGGVS